MLEKIRSNQIFNYLWVLITCLFHIGIFRTKVDYDYAAWFKLVIFLVTVAVTLAVHELIHFVLMKLFCKGTVKIQFGKDPAGFPGLRTVSEGEMKKWQRIIVYLAPFVILTVALDIAFAYMPRINLVIYIVAIGNSAGSFFDIMDALIAARK